MHDLPASIFPELERQLDLRRKTDLTLLSAFVTPQELRDASEFALIEHLQDVKAHALAQRLVVQARACAQRQTMTIPGERLSARLVKELAAEALAVLLRQAELDKEIAARLAAHPDAALIRSLPGMGALLTAEFIAVAGSIARFRCADALAAAAGLAPVLKQSGKSSWLKRPRGGNKDLKRIFYQVRLRFLAQPGQHGLLCP